MGLTRAFAATIEAGANIINDVSGGLLDPAMLPLAADLSVPTSPRPVFQALFRPAVCKANRRVCKATGQWRGTGMPVPFSLVPFKVPPPSNRRRKQGDPRARYGPGGIWRAAQEFPKTALRRGAGPCLFPSRRAKGSQSNPVFHL